MGASLHGRHTFIIVTAIVTGTIFILLFQGYSPRLVNHSFTEQQGTPKGDLNISSSISNKSVLDNTSSVPKTPRENVQSNSKLQDKEVVSTPKPQGEESNPKSRGKEEKPQGPKKIVLWNNFFGREQWYVDFPEDSKQVGITCQRQNECIASYDKSDPLQYDALLFHGRDAYSIPRQRRPDQVYAMLLWESPIFRGEVFVNGGTFYNWTATYSHQSDIFAPYGRYHKLDSKNDTMLAQLPAAKVNGTSRQRAVIAWVVSHCNTPNHRSKFVDALQKHIKVDIFGRCGRPCPYSEIKLNDPNCHERLGASGQYKFYLSFENSMCPDYITEKLWTGALGSGLVPIVLGGTSTEDYERLLPPGSFIDVRNFTSPKALADYLHYLDSQTAEYLQYHSWRSQYGISGGLNITRVLCDVCDGLYDDQMMTPRNVDWGSFWNEKDCRNEFVYNMLAGTSWF